jgi:hypothetical protein
MKKTTSGGTKGRATAAIKGIPLSILDSRIWRIYNRRARAGQRRLHRP